MRDDDGRGERRLQRRRFARLLPLIAVAGCASGAGSSATSAPPPPAPPPAPLAAATTTRERSVREIAVKSELAYLRTLPRGYLEPSVPGAPRWPLVLFLHGMG